VLGAKIWSFIEKSNIPPKPVIAAHMFVVKKASTGTSVFKVQIISFDTLIPSLVVPVFANKY